MSETKADYTATSMRCQAVVDVAETAGNDLRPSYAVLVYKPCERAGLPCPHCGVRACDAHQASHLQACVALKSLVPA